jgi:L-lactate dehydrogenase complex protein LldG
MPSTGRERVLHRVRAALGRSAPLTAAQSAPLRDYVAAHRAGPQPRMQQQDLVARFRSCALRSSTTVAEVETLAAVPAAVARYLAAERLPPAAVAWSELGALDWQGAGLAVELRKANAQDGVGITGCFCALAETGTLLQLSASRRPASTSLVPDTHIAILPASRIVATMEDAWELLRRECGTLPRATNFISGPSRTADIEQTLVLGAHGPCRVHIVLVQT